jgi:hypothetical protein
MTLFFLAIAAVSVMLSAAVPFLAFVALVALILAVLAFFDTASLTRW